METAHAMEAIQDAERDRRLIARIASGDRDALAHLYDHHAPVMLGVAIKFLKQRRDAEDVLHDVFLEIWSKAGSYEPERASVRTWMMMRLRSRALDRKKSAHVARTSSLEAHALDAADERPPPDPDRHAVVAAVAALPDVQRVVLELAYFEGLSSSEIAERLEVPIGTVKSRVAGGMRHLRQALRDHRDHEYD